MLAPLNSEMLKLPRKPWEDPADAREPGRGQQAYVGQDGEDRARANLGRFVQAHVVPVSPWGEGVRVKALAGNEVWFEVRGGKRLVRWFLSFWFLWALSFFGRF